MADLSEYKQAIAEAFEGRAVRDAIVAMVQAVEDAINAGSTAALETRVAALESGVSDLETTVSGTDGLESKVTALDTTVYGTGGLGSRVGALEGSFGSFSSDANQRFDALDQRVTALEGG